MLRSKRFEYCCNCSHQFQSDAGRSLNMTRLHQNQNPVYGKYGTFRRDLGCARRKFEVCSVQRLASGHFKCAHLETFQIR